METSENPQKRPLILSFSGLVGILFPLSPEERQLLVDDLVARAIVYFGCTREHIMLSETEDEITLLARHLVNGLEADKGPDNQPKRIIWRPRSLRTQDIYALSGILQKNGHPPIGKPPLADPEASQILPRHNSDQTWSEYAWELICKRNLDNELELVGKRRY